MTASLKPWTCPCCGKVYDTLPALTYAAPFHWFACTGDELGQNSKLSSDFCVLRGVDYFIRAVLFIPIVHTEQHLEFGVWTSLSEENFQKYYETFDDDDQSSIGEMFGWFSSQIAGYQDSVNLKCRVVPQDSRQRPMIELEPTDHLLAVHQRLGVTLDYAMKYAHEHLGV